MSKLSSKISLGAAITFGISIEIMNKIKVFIRTCPENGADKKR